MSDAVIAEQLAYYRARADEYDEWFLREGRYDRGAAHRARWQAEVDAVRTALHRGGRVAGAIELACGTGLWTRELVELCDHVTALDGAPEMLDINRARVGGGAVEHHEVDLFTWRPGAQHDLLFAGFWLSHVPPERLDAQLATMRAALAPGGRLFLVDSLRTPASTAVDQVIPDAGTVLTRTLNDGRRFQIVKAFHEPATLEARLDAAGFDGAVHTTGEFFWYADAVRR